jgi:hypothetical protein
VAAVQMRVLEKNSLRKPTAMPTLDCTETKNAEWPSGVTVKEMK